MTRPASHRLSFFAIAAFIAALTFLTTHSLGGTHSSVSVARSSEKSVVAMPAESRSGWRSWLGRLLPRNIQFNGPAIDSDSQSRVVATSTCYEHSSCYGFRNLEQYLAAVHASQNLGIPFDRLKSRIQEGKTLRQAIEELRPTRNSRVEAQRAQQQAQKTLRELSS